jgi:bifunctional DNA-binding transcriptional regulator/antitoxin component of YhaV-PrlF toxin-antitoxin module
MAVTYKNPGRIEFDGKLNREEGGGIFVNFPHDVEQLYGVKGRVPVNVTFDGIPYRGSMVKMSGPSHILLILKEIRDKLGKDKGDAVHVTVELDEAPRVVVLARDVEAGYIKAEILDQYRSLSFTHQREFNLWIEDAKQAETRKRRIEKAIEQIRAKKKTG